MTTPKSLCRRMSKPQVLLYGQLLLNQQVNENKLSILQRIRRDPVKWAVLKIMVVDEAIQLSRTNIHRYSKMITSLISMMNTEHLQSSQWSMTEAMTDANAIEQDLFARYCTPDNECSTETTV